MGRVVSTEIRKILAYRSDFWLNFIGNTLIHLFIARSLWQSIFMSNGVTEMKGLTLSQLTLYYLLAPLATKVLMGENLGFFAREIYDGGLNRYLVWPLPAIGYKTLTYLTYSIFYLAQMALLYTIGRFVLNDAPVTMDEAVRFILGLCYFIFAAYAYFNLQSLCEMVAFWADNSWTLGVMLRFVTAFFGGIFLPLDFYPPWLQDILFYLPFSAMVSTPINLIMGRIEYSAALQSFLVLLFWIPFLIVCVRLMWKRGNLRYTGIGM